MKKTSINALSRDQLMNLMEKVFSEMYATFYDNPEIDAAYPVDVALELLEDPTAFKWLQALEKHVQDIICSDRELKAFAITYKTMKGMGAF